MEAPITKMRLLLFEDCNRGCPGCCNKDWNLNTLPKVEDEDFKHFKEFLLTGGEPLLKPEVVVDTIYRIRRNNKDAKIYVYTAQLDMLTPFYYICRVGVEGYTVTLHNQKDVEHFNNFQLWFNLWYNAERYSMRVNVFKGIELPEIIFPWWKIKRNMVWRKNCPLPNGEIFMRL